MGSGSREGPGRGFGVSQAGRRLCGRWSTGSRQLGPGALLTHSRSDDRRRFRQARSARSPGRARRGQPEGEAGLTADGRRKALAEMSSLHKAVVEATRTLADDSWARKAPVVYREGQDPYPTSPQDILGWLREHYREHVQQCPELVDSWRETARAVDSPRRASRISS